MKKLVIILLILGFNVHFCMAESGNSPRIIVKYKNGVESVLAVLEKDLAEQLLYYNSLSDVEFAEKDHIYRAAIIPSDSFFGNQWYLKRLKAPEAWNISRGDGSLVLAVIDSGIQVSHPDLKDNIWRNPGEVPGNGIDDDNNGYIDDWQGWDFTANDNDPSPDFSGLYNEGILHGTIVAGVAAASGNNAAGIAGINWNLKIMPLKALNDQGQGSTHAIIQAIRYAVANGADVINFSFVGENKSRSLEDEIRSAYESGLIMVAAAGNDEGHGKALDEVPLYPACYDGQAGENMVIGVAATGPLDQKSSFSSFGSRCVDISAPGESIFSTTVYSPGNTVNGQKLDSYYDGYWAGTSLASPMVAGAIALAAETNKSLGSREVIELVISQSDNITRLNPGFFGQLGAGRLNVFNPVESAREMISLRNYKILVAPESDKDPRVSLRNFNGENFKEFFSYDKNFRGGVNVAAGDVNGDGIDEIITGAGNGGGPHVRIFDQTGSILAQFFAYGQNFRGGVNVAAGDVNGDGIDEIITGAGNGGGPHVRIFKPDGRLVSHFFAYDKNFRGGVNVAAGKILAGPRNSKKQIVTSPGYGAGSTIRIFSEDGNMISQFEAFHGKFLGGSNISTVDLSGDGLDEIVAAASKSGGPHVKIFDGDFRLYKSFYAYEPDFSGGVSVSVLDLR